MPPSILDLEIDWADCDPAGIVFHPQVFRIMNIGTHKMFERVGLPFRDLIERFGTAGVPLLDVQATFRSPARFGDHVRLESEITEWREKTFLVHHVMRKDERVVFE